MCMSAHMFDMLTHYCGGLFLYMSTHMFDMFTHYCGGLFLYMICTHV